MNIFRSDRKTVIPALIARQSGAGGDPIFSILLSVFLIFLFARIAYANGPEVEQSVRARLEMQSQELQGQPRETSSSRLARIRREGTMESGRFHAADALQLKPEEVIGFIRRKVAQGLVVMYGKEAAPVTLDLAQNFRQVVGEYLKSLLFQLANGTANSRKDALILEAILRNPEILNEVGTAQKIYAGFASGDLRISGPTAAEWEALVREEGAISTSLQTSYDADFLPNIARQFAAHRSFPVSESTASIFSFYTGYSGDVEKSLPLGADLVMSFIVILNNAGMTQIKQSDMDVIDGMMKLCMMVKKSSASDGEPTTEDPFKAKFESFLQAVADYYMSLKHGVAIPELQIKLTEIDSRGFETFGSVMGDFGGEHSFRTSESGRKIIDNLPFSTVLETLNQSKDALRRAIKESGQDIRTEEINYITIRGYHSQTGDLIITVNSSPFYTGNVLIRGLMQQVQGASSTHIAPDNIVVLNEPYSDAKGKYLELPELFDEITLDNFVLSESSKHIVEAQVRARGITPVSAERRGVAKRIFQGAGKKLARWGIRGATEADINEKDRSWIEKITERSVKVRRGASRRAGATGV